MAVSHSSSFIWNSDYLLYLSVKKMKMQVTESSNTFKTWYPSLEKTVSLLSKLYERLESSVFTGLAQVRNTLGMKQPTLKSADISYAIFTDSGGSLLPIPSGPYLFPLISCI